MSLQFDIPRVKSSIIKVFGVGGGGSNAVNHMYRQGIKGVDFIICNTDSQALDLSPVPNKLQIGNNLTEGRGAGSKPEVGQKAAQESNEEIRNLLANDTKMIFITAGMGGGTGTGAAPVIAKIAKELGILTVGIVTKPFVFEGPQRKGKAMDGIENLKKHVDTLLVIDNEKLRGMFGNAPISAAFAQADNILATAAKGIAEIITVPGYINVDFEDVKTVMADSGVAIMGSGYGEGEDRALKAVEAAMHSPLLSENDIQGANHILLNITSGTQEILMDEISIITSYIQEEAGLGADMIWGHCYDDTLGEKILVTLIATGFEPKTPVKQQEKVVLPLEEVKPAPVMEVPRITVPEPVVAPAPVSQPEAAWEPVIKKEEPVQQPKPQNTYAPASKPEPKQEKIIFEEEEPHHEIERERRVQTLSDNSRGKSLEDLEKVPAYIRRKIKLQNVPHSSESNISRYNLADDPEDSVSIRPRNSFLHDNVD